MANYYLFVFSIFLLPIIFLFLKRRSARRLPPGPWRLPLIGSVHHMLSSRPVHQLFRDLAQRYAPDLMHLKLGELNVIVASSPEAAMAITKTHDHNFASRQMNPSMEIMTYGGKDISFAPYGDHWREMRKICVTELLTVKRVQSVRDIREEEVAALVQDVADESAASPTHSVGIRKLINSLTISIMSRVLIGERRKNYELFMEEIERGVKMAERFTIADLYPSFKFLGRLNGVIREAEECRDRAFDALGDIIEEHRRSGRVGHRDDSKNNMLDALLAIMDEGNHAVPLDINIIKAVVFELFAAGSDSVEGVMDWVMVELLRNPRVMQLATQEVRQHFAGEGKVTDEKVGELKYLKLVIREAVRMHPPLPLLVPRQCRKACRVLGYDIPEGAAVFVNAWAIGRDARSWSEPDEFRPERFIDCPIDYLGMDFEYVPFGAGRRKCPGTSFGLAEISLAIANLLFHFDWKLSEGMKPSDIDIYDEVFGTTARLRSDIPAVAIPRSAAMVACK